MSRRKLNPYTPLVTNDLEGAVGGDPEEVSSSSAGACRNDLGTRRNDLGRRSNDLGRRSNDVGRRSNDLDRSPNDLDSTDLGKSPNDLRKMFLKDKKAEDSDLNSLFSGLCLDEKALKEGPIVLYYGWFFPEDVCYALKEISEAYLRQCFFGVPQCERFLTSLCEKASAKDELTFYRYPSKNRKSRELPGYHVTSRFCDRDPSICSEYWQKVSHLLGSTSDIHIIGLYFTEKTYGFRVKLTKAQEEIFDERDVLSRVKPSGSSNQLQDQNTSKESLDPCHNVNSKKSNSKSKSVKPLPSDYHPKILIAPQEKDFSPCKSRAHITIGTAQNVPAVQAGEDLKDLVDLESRSRSVDVTDYVLETGDILRQFGRYGDAFVIYLRNEFIVEGEFSFKE